MTPDSFIPNQWYPIFDSSKLKIANPSASRASASG